MQIVNVPKQEYLKLKQRAELNENLLTKLVRGLEDIKSGRIRRWKKSI